MRTFTKDEDAWCYNYEQGLYKATIKDGVIHGGLGITVITPQGNDMVVLLSEIFESRDEAEAYSFAINYKRGWLQRELEKHPSDLYNERMKDSIERFPELWI